jgi:hypothetical protein
MTFVPPTLSGLRSVVLRSLRDPGGKVFSADDVDDFIREGMTDLDGFRPIEGTATYVWDGTTSQPDPKDLSSIFHLELATLDGQFAVPFNDPQGGWDARDGWSYFAGSVRLSNYWAGVVRSLWQQEREPRIVMWGYRDRVLPKDDAEILDLRDTTDEMCVAKYCRMLGFQRLAHDRSLYQQWLASTNNTDVSPTQLQGMLAQAENEYDRQRKRSLQLRRTPFGGTAIGYTS